MTDRIDHSVVANADEAEQERDALMKERDALAAVIENVHGVARGYIDQPGHGDYYMGMESAGEGILEVLDTSPADALREVKAQAWREGWDASERFGYLDGALETPLNPYLEADDD